MAGGGGAEREARRRSGTPRRLPREHAVGAGRADDPAGARRCPGSQAGFARDMPSPLDLADCLAGFAAPCRDQRAGWRSQGVGGRGRRGGEPGGGQRAEGKGEDAKKGGDRSLPP